MAHRDASDDAFDLLGPGGPPGGGSAPPLGPLNLPPAVIDSRLVDDGLGQLVQGLSKLKLEGGGGELPVRPGFGTLGKAIKLRANYFPLQKFPAALYEYDVQVSLFDNRDAFSSKTCIQFTPGMKIRRVKVRLALGCASYTRAQCFLSAPAL